MEQEPRDLAAKAWRAIVIAAWVVREILTTAWAIVRGPLILVLQIFAALIVLFEEWGWKPLSEALAALARYAPIAVIERWIAALPPYGALAVFALPTAILLPLKFVAMWLLAAGQYWTATGLFVAAKIASTAWIARIFTLTKPALMQISWFEQAYALFVPWKDAFFATIRASWVWRYGRMVKNAIRLEVKQAWTRWRPGVLWLASAAVQWAKVAFERVRAKLMGG